MANPTRNHPSSSAHRSLQTSTTLSRRYVKRPASVYATSPVTSNHNISPTETSPISSPRDLVLRRRQAIAEKINRERLNKIRRGYLAVSTSSTSTTTRKSAPKPITKITSTSKTTAEVTPKTTPKKIAISSTIKTEQKTNRAASEHPNRTIPERPSKPTSKRSAASSAVQPHPYQAIVRSRLSAKAKKPLPTAKELKDKAITDALRSVATMTETTPPVTKQPKQRFFHGRRALLAVSCALASVSALGYLVHRNFPDISVRVTAMQAGFDVRYPSFIPEGYHISGITSEKPAKITMKFINDKHHFTISEERSAWDSQSLLHNFVKPTWNNQYTTTREQGITVFLSGKTSACWVNGGVLYKITTSGHLDKLQLHNIIHSL